MHARVLVPTLGYRFSDSLRKSVLGRSPYTRGLLCYRAPSRQERVAFRPPTTANTMFSIPARTFSKKARRGKPKMSSTPHHHGSTRAYRVMAPRSVEPTSMQFECATRGKMMFRDQEKLQLLKRFRQSLDPAAPWAGFYTAGEIGPVEEHNLRHLYTSVVLALS
jgi:FIST-like protein